MGKRGERKRENGREQGEINEWRIEERGKDEEKMGGGRKEIRKEGSKDGRKREKEGRKEMQEEEESEERTEGGREAGRERDERERVRVSVGR